MGSRREALYDSKYRNQYLLGAFFFANVTLGGSCAIQDKQTPTLAAAPSPPKKKAWQKRNAVLSGLCAPNPQELFEKSSTKNWMGASRGGGRKLKNAPPKT
jgi:hypothetical protein